MRQAWWCTTSEVGASVGPKIGGQFCGYRPCCTVTCCTVISAVETIHRAPSGEPATGQQETGKNDSSKVEIARRDEHHGSRNDHARGRPREQAFTEHSSETSPRLISWARLLGARRRLPDAKSSADGSDGAGAWSLGVPPGESISAG